MNKRLFLLIAEDEPDLLEILVELLSPLGFPIETAKNGNELFAKALRNDIAAILSDIKMPGLTGIEVLQILRDKDIHTPVIFLTGYGDKNIVVEALRLGAFDFLDKPFDFSELNNTVSEALDIGQRLKSIDEEVNNLVKKYNIQKEDIGKFKEVQKTILIMKIKNEIAFKAKKRIG